jgi:cytochrome d ubiquinol oxidase subunit II
LWLAFGGAAAVATVALVAGSRPLLAGAVLLLGAGLLARTGREAPAFGGVALGVAAAVVAVFTAHGDLVLVSTLDPAWSLTRADAAATASALRLLTGAAVVVLPGVLAYQAFSYWVFRRRVASERVPS